MNSFLKTVLATIVGLIIFNVIGLILFFAFVSAASTEEEVKVKANTVLHLKLNKQIIERDEESPVPMPFSNLDDRIGLVDLLKAIEHAKEDDHIKGIYLEPKFVRGGYASLQEIRDALIDFKSTGKFIYAYGEYLSEADYYLASVADEVMLNPEGLLEFNGLDAQVPFIKGTLEKLHVEPQIFRVGEFKSAVEPLIRKDMSEASRLQTSSYLNSMYKTYLENVAKSRGLTVNRLQQVSDEMLVRNADDALKYQIVDRLTYYDEVERKIKDELDLEEKDKLNTISYKKYNKSFKANKYSSSRVAVIVATGGIQSGKGDRETIGSDKFAAEIRKARKNDKIKAIVLRINSPGGSALASDVIWREVKLAAEEKPVIASMSDVAASGGYYIAMAADTIFAQPNTITGSIGIFGVIFNAKGLLEDKIGVTTDVVKTGQYSDIMTMTRPLNDFEKEIIQTQVEEGYETFTTKAAEGRNMKLADLKAVASGRVWTGRQAVDIGLVDVLGGLGDAIDAAAKSAGIEEDYTVQYLPKPKTFFEEFFEDLNTEMETRIMKKQFGDLYPYVKMAREAKQYQGIQARMPYDIIVE